MVLKGLQRGERGGREEEREEIKRKWPNGATLYKR